MFQYGFEVNCVSLWFYYCTPSFHHMISYFLYVATSTLDPLGCHHLSPRLSAAPRFKDANNISYDNLISMTAMAAHEVSWVWEESLELGWSLQLFSVCLEVCQHFWWVPYFFVIMTPELIPNIPCLLKACKWIGKINCRNSEHQNVPAHMSTQVNSQISRWKWTMCAGTFISSVWCFAKSMCFCCLLISSFFWQVMLHFHGISCWNHEASMPQIWQIWHFWPLRRMIFDVPK